MNRAGNKNEDRPFARMYLPPSSFPSSFFLSPLRDRQHLPRSPTMRSKNKPSPFSLLLLAHHCAQEDRKCKCERRERSEITSNYFVALVYISPSSEHTFIFHMEERMITSFHAGEIDGNVRYPRWQRFRPPGGVFSLRFSPSNESYRISKAAFRPDINRSWYLS